MVTAGDRVLLFGGRFTNVAYFGDAWTWDGTKWSRVDQGVTPKGRAAAAVAWDGPGGSLFVFGGFALRPDSGPGNQGLPLNDAWTLNNGRWSEIKAPGPPATSDANAVWSSSTRSAIILFGIVCPNPSQDAWSWDGSAWTHATAMPPARWGGAVASNPDGGVLLFGGSDEVGC
jgi:hypothetical protein